MHECPFYIEVMIHINHYEPNVPQLLSSSCDYRAGEITVDPNKEESSSSSSSSSSSAEDEEEQRKRRTARKEVFDWITCRSASI